MKIYYFLALFLILSFTSNAQIVGKVTDTNKENLPFVSVLIKDTYKGTTTNNEGDYSLNISKTGNYTLIFQYLGYKTIHKEITITSFPYQLDIVLAEEAFSLNEIEISSTNNPANRIIKETIANRKVIREKMAEYKADFYSRGIFRIKDAPKKIMGFEIGDMGGGLDSTRSGVIYLSETISKITQSKTKFKERVIASKISGDDNGFSFNSASDVNFNFYKNTIDLGDVIVSPIANNAFNYYTYKLANTFYEGVFLVNKIKVIPKRKTDNAFNGFIYIIEDSWQIYAIDLYVFGKQIQQPMVKKLTLKQNYSYTSKPNLWSLFSQSIDFKFGMFGLNIDGRFTAVYSNYEFNPVFTKKTFTREVMSYEDKANKKDSLFWNKKRPVPLTLEESSDYKLKDSIKIIRKSKKYLDSIDTQNNKFKLINLLTGYSYKNSYKNNGFTIGSPLNAMFNTVQGWHPNLAVNYHKNYKEKHQNLWIRGNVEYGLSDKKIRPNMSLTYKFNAIKKPYLSISAGNKLTMFSGAISTTLNGVTSLLFERNYAKYYDKTYASIGFGQEVFNGIRLNSSISYEKRKPVFNTTSYVTRNRDGIVYSSNNPLLPNDYNNAVIDNHDIYKFRIGANFTFANQYISLPNEKRNLGNRNYPKLGLNYTIGFASNETRKNYSLIQARIHQNISLKNKGTFSYNLKAGKFFNDVALSFADYKHFNGNQTHVNLKGNYTNSFALLPYYDFSTNNEYAELHAEHQFNGYILRKIPLLNKLQFKLVVGAKTLLTKEHKPYSEFNIGLQNMGIGKYRFLRVDYVRSVHNGTAINGVLFGLTL